MFNQAICPAYMLHVWDWSLIMGRGGGLQNGRGGGASEVSPLRKVGGTKSFKVVLARELEVLAILMGAGKGFHLLKGGGHKKL